MDELSPRLQLLFEQAIELDSLDRPAFLAEACGHDYELRRQLDSLLAHHDQADEFLEQPALGRDFYLPDPDRLADERSVPDVVGRIDRYELIRIIGEGGMSSVYLARRDDKEFDRQVAIKVIKPGMVSAGVIRRFRLERQALAQLDHPNIARLFDGGTTSTGMPYIVMEHIDGAPITEYCDRRRLSTIERLRLFCVVCSAVRYAHQKLVLHRDLKPGNILVTESGEPKLLDFGIAKLLQPDEGPFAPLTTGTEQHFFTPEYASPEQVGSVPVSTATDVYSLGVVLYELLTGHRPYRFSSRSSLELERTIREMRPLEPSTVINRVEEITTGDGTTRVITPASVSATRDGRPERLRRRLAGDVDRIVMMALRKEPERRYPSVEQLGEDIRRHLAGMPVSARKDTLRYRTTKYVLRHRAALVVLVLLLITLTASYYFTVRDRRRAQALDVAEQVREFLLEMRDQPTTVSSSRDATRRALSTDLAGLTAESLRDQPREFVQFAESIAGVCERHYLREEAAYWTGAAYAVLADELNEDPSTLAEPRFRLACALHGIGQLEQADDHLQVLEQACRSLPNGGLLAAVLFRQALVRWSCGDFTTAEQLFEQALPLLEEDTDRAIDVVIRARMDFARFLEERGELERARSLLRQTLARSRDAPPDLRPLLAAEVWCQLGMLLWNTPDFRMAEPLVREGMATLLSRQDDGADDIRIAACSLDLALMFNRGGNRSSSIPTRPAGSLWLAGHKRLVRVFGDDSLEVADSHRRLAEILVPTDPGEICAKALGLYQRWVPEDELRPAAIQTLLGKHFLMAAEPNLAAAEQHLRQAHEIRRRLLPGRHWRVAESGGLLGMVMLRLGHADRAEPLLLESLDIVERLHGPEHPRTGVALRRLVELYAARSDRDREDFYRCRLEEHDRAWPFGRTYRDVGRRMDHFTSLDFEDDQAEKVIVIPDDPGDAEFARLWVFGKYCNFSWARYRKGETHVVQVNLDPARARSFDVGVTFSFLDDFHWAYLDIPVEWLGSGPNHFTLYEANVDGWREKKPWEYNNLLIGIETDRDHDHSWWFGSHEQCCLEMVRAAQAAKKPFRPSAVIDEHREVGYRECEGELMIFLELGLPR